MLSTNLTLKSIMQGNYGDARVEMKKTTEREKLIESFRENTINSRMTPRNKR